MFREINPNARHALLPEELDVYRIGHVEVDDVRFVRPYAMRVDMERRLWLDATQSDQSRRGGAHATNDYAHTRRVLRDSPKSSGSGLGFGRC